MTVEPGHENRSAVIAVLGSGSWGTALAAALQRGGLQVRLWARRADVAHAIQTTRRNPRHLPEISLPEGLQAGTDLQQMLAGADGLIVAVPSNEMRGVARRAAQALTRRIPALTAAKGIEHGSGALMTEVLREELGHDRPTGVIAGPSFAHEVARSQPTTLTLAMRTLAEPGAAQARAFADALHGALRRAAIEVEVTDDDIGVQIAGALKNTIAIACGMASGLGLGENARAAIITRGLDDMRRLTLALGGRTDTLLYSSGVGDLFLTAASSQSRNTRLGLRLARDEPADAAEDVVEGAVTSLSVSALERRLGLRLTVAHAVRDVLARRVSSRRAVERLLTEAPGRPDTALAPALRAAPASCSAASDLPARRVRTPRGLRRMAQ